MSKAGVLSSVGDEYQSLVATMWAIEMLSNSEIDKIEVDATSHIAHGIPFLVDDIVVSFKNGPTICCQCKKNQTKFEDWKPSDLGEDLVTAWKQWNIVPEFKIIFYSRHSFGILARIQERASKIAPNSNVFLYDMPKDMQIEYAKIKELLKNNSDINVDDEAVYSFFKVIKFESLADVSLKNLLIATLRPFITHPEDAFELLMRIIDSVARRSSNFSATSDVNNTINKHYLVDKLREQGHRITSPVSLDNLFKYFEKLSLRGRAWPRDIHSIHLKRNEISVILDNLNSGAKSILIHGDPGTGKTCIVLDLVDSLQASEKFFPVFLQSKDFNDVEFKDIVNDLLNNISLMSESKHVIVVIDSLDVLSISREQSLLSEFLSFIHTSSKLKNVIIVASCRSFDIKYDSRLSSVSWESQIKIEPLDFESDVKSILCKSGIDIKYLSESQKSVLTNPQMLKMYISIAKKGERTQAQTSCELIEKYLNVMVLDDSRLGSAAFSSLANAAQTMISERSLEILRARFQSPANVINLLLSAGILLETDRGTLTFSHQTLLDSLAVTAAELNKTTLLDFIRQHKPVPFIRPSIRTFFFQLRTHDCKAFRRQVRAVFEAKDVAFHLKRLIATSLAEVIPNDDDWSLFIFIYKEHTSLFNSFFNVARSREWSYFIYNKFFPFLQSEQNGIWCLRVAERMTSVAHISSEEIIHLWLSLLKANYCDKKATTFSASRALAELSIWNSCDLRELFSVLLDNLVGIERDFFGKPLSLWIDATNKNDDILWSYIIRSYNPKEKTNAGNELNCKSHYFHSKDFLIKRMASSEELLSLAIASIQEWHEAGEEPARFSREKFLWETSYQEHRSQRDLKTITPLAELIKAVELACMNHAKRNSTWWNINAKILASSNVLGLQYIAIRGLTLRPFEYKELIFLLLKTIKDTNGYPFHNELAELFGHASPAMTEGERVEIQNIILNIYPDITEREQPGFVLFAQADFFVELPSPYRLPEAQSIIDLATKYRGVHPRKPSPMTWGGVVHAPFSYKKFLEYPDSFSTAIAQYYTEASKDSWTRDYLENSLIGGTREVAGQFTEAVSRDPIRFLALSRLEWEFWSLPFREAILDGLGNHLRYRFGNLRPNGEWEPLSSPSNEDLAEALLSIIENKNISDLNEYTLARALLACAERPASKDYIERVCFWLIRLSYSKDPQPEDKMDAMTGYNSLRGMAATSCIRLAVRWCENFKDAQLPDLLVALLYRFARDDHAAVRAMILQELPFVIFHQKKLGWELFDLAMTCAPDWIWNSAYDCLYYNYHAEFPRIERYLLKMSTADLSTIGETFGAILALSLISEKIEIERFKTIMDSVEPYQPWKAIFDIFSHNIKNPEIRNQCISGLEYALSKAPKVNELFHIKEALFDDEGNFFTIPISLVSSLFDFCLEVKGDSYYGFYRLPKWLVKAAQIDTAYSLDILEMLLKKMEPFDSELTVSEDFAELLTLFFREAEENEEVDNGDMLNRVLVIQDYLLEKGVYKLEEWLSDAERP